MFHIYSVYRFMYIVFLQKRKAELAKIELGCEMLRQKLNAPVVEEKVEVNRHSVRRSMIAARKSTTSDLVDDFDDWEGEYDYDDYSYGYSPVKSPSPRDSVRRSKEKTEIWKQKESLLMARKLASVKLEEENVECESEESEIFTASSGSSKESTSSKKKSKTRVNTTIARISIHFDAIIDYDASAS